MGLNGDTCRRVARAQVERECHVARAIGVTSWNRLSLSERSQLFAVPMSLKIVEDPMYGIDWPMSCDDPLFQEAMDIAMTYLEQVGILRLFVDAEELVTGEILDAWRRGVRHKIALANAAIVAVEKQAGTLPSVFPDVRLVRP
jgi:hypothetical protein